MGKFKFKPEMVLSLLAGAFAIGTMIVTGEKEKLAKDQLKAEITEDVLTKLSKKEG